MAICSYKRIFANRYSKKGLHFINSQMHHFVMFYDNKQSITKRKITNIQLRIRFVA